MDNELLLALSDMMDSKLEPIKNDILKVQGNMMEMQGSIAEMQGKITEMQGKITEMQGSITGINLHLENVTDRNISLLAENHGSLIDKLNESIKVADKDSLTEIRVNILTEKVSKMEKEIDDLKNKIA